MANEKIGSVRVADGADYGRAGFVIEQLGYGGSFIASEPTWAIPAWEEMGLGNLAGPFATRTAAAAALVEA